MLCSRRRSRSRARVRALTMLYVALALFSGYVGFDSTAYAGETNKQTGLAPLVERLDALIEAELPKGARQSVSVIDLRTGQSVYANNPSLALNPASNIKLLTSAAALFILGPEHRFSTKILLDKKKLSAGILRGPLCLQGSGDPSLVTANLYELAARLSALGVKEVRGALMIDSGSFDHDGFPPGYEQKQEFASYRAPGGGAAINYSTYEVLIRPGDQVGKPPHAAIVPAVQGIRVINEATTNKGKKRKITLHVDSESTEITVTLRGTIGDEAHSLSYRYPVENPSLYTAQVFALVLKQAGIKLSSQEFQFSSPGEHTSVVTTYRSDPISTQIRAVNKLSNNFMAEQLLRSLVQQERAAASDSLHVLRNFTRTIQMPQQDLVLGNGSGLYDNNKISASQMSHLLTVMYQDFRYQSDFMASLAIAGTDGTLRRRLRDKSTKRWIRAKTGTLDGVSALSGYAGAEGKTPYAFSILINDLGRGSLGAARRLQNKIAAELSKEASLRAP